MFRSFFKYLLIFLSITFINKETEAINGEDISNKISEWLLLEGISGEPVFSKKSVYKDCSSELQITRVFKDYKTIKLSCLDIDGFKLFVRIKLKEKKHKKHKKIAFKSKVPVSIPKSKSIKQYISIKLKRALEKNTVIQFNDIDLVMSSKSSQKSFFTSKKDILGRKLKQNLKMGQLLHPRHLYEKFDIQSGDYLSIVSHVGSASVTVSGEAAESGNLGDLIKVKNLRSGNIIKGYVKKNKIIRVYR
ncbi:flagellar basal body P-ring formation chaperone FlgA [Alphaproteobacteria bacterium]|nr:flagellar basal body P-ring formation chaperone FlgA [Alphaproteobacteria bacterium]